VSTAGAREALEAAYRIEARRVLATLIRLLGGFEAAEEALHEAFAAAAEQWPREGVPANPYGWLVSTGRFRTIDRWRRQGRLAGALLERAATAQTAWEPALPEHLHDDELRLIFTCCHPALAPDARIALTLREVGGLTTEEIARAYLAAAPTIAQRIVRAKAKIRDAATAGPSLTRDDLCAEAIRLGRLVVDLLDEPEALGLLALMLLHEARRSTRVDAAGDLILLEHQDRSRWDRGRIAEAQGLIERALLARRIGPFLLQAAIAAVHAEAASEHDTDWAQIVGLYDTLVRVAPSPVVALNRAAALGRRDGPEAGLAAIEAVMGGGALDAYPLAHAARADLQRQLGQAEAARTSYERALELTKQPAEQRFLQARLRRLALS
jgi:RNA polymerase sigma-70 factor (ECF subfamily)